MFVGYAIGRQTMEFASDEGRQRLAGCLAAVAQGDEQLRRFRRTSDTCPVTV